MDSFKFDMELKELIERMDGRRIIIIHQIMHGIFDIFWIRCFAVGDNITYCFVVSNIEPRNIGV